MKKMLILVTIIFLGNAFSQGVLNIDSAQITPAPLATVENNGTGTFTFDIFESGFVDVPVGGSPATITISLSNIDLIDAGNSGANSVSGYEPYFDIFYGSVGGNPQITLWQIATIPALTSLGITMNIAVTANTFIDNPNNGGNVNLTPGTGQDVGTDYTEIYTYTDENVPVELSEFVVNMSLEGVKLEWTTESEIENLGFILERKIKGTDTSWEELSSYKTNDDIVGQGTTSSSTSYSFVDYLVEVNTTYNYRLGDVDYDGVVTYHATREVTVDMKPLGKVEKFTVLPNYPNPFNPTTTIRYGLDKDSKVNIQIYDITGRLTTTLVNKDEKQGWHAITWNGTNQHGKLVPAGIYLSRVISDNKVITKKMMLLK